MYHIRAEKISQLFAMSTAALGKHDFATQPVIYSMSDNNDVIEIVGNGSYAI